MKKEMIPHDLNVDLHVHSNASDGQLSPTELVYRAHKNNVDIFSLTDHDSINGLNEALDCCSEKKIQFIPGVEISVTWSKKTIHILGLNLDFFNSQLNFALSSIQNTRYERAKAMDESLKKHGLPSLFDDAFGNAGSKGQIGRLHFARAIISKKICASLQEVFQNYLVPGKPGFIEHTWLSLSESVKLINNAGGVAVLAHPARYRLSEIELSALIDDFRFFGGVAIEVASGCHNNFEIKKFQKIANEHNLLASRGTDFHCPDESRLDVGQAPYLPDSCSPVWASWI